MTRYQQLLQQPMTRKQFIIVLATGIGGLFGLSSLFGLFSQATPPAPEFPGYGLRNYGP